MATRTPFGLLERADYVGGFFKTVNQIAAEQQPRRTAPGDTENYSNEPLNDAVVAFSNAV